MPPPHGNSEKQIPRCARDDIAQWFRDERPSEERKGWTQSLTQALVFFHLSIEEVNDAVGVGSHFAVVRAYS